MKTKKINKKLFLNKKTIANLKINEMNYVKGGTIASVIKCPGQPTLVCTGPYCTIETCEGYTCDHNTCNYCP